MIHLNWFKWETLSKYLLPFLILSRYFEYIVRKKEDKSEIGYAYLLNEYPKELTKKLNLLKHFKTYLENKKEKPNLVILKFCFYIKE